MDIHGEALRTIIVRDITARKLQEQRLQYEATHYSLTDLPNRAALMGHLEVALTRTRPDSRVALLMLDLCRFKDKTKEAELVKAKAPISKSRHGRP